MDRRGVTIHKKSFTIEYITFEPFYSYDLVRSNVLYSERPLVYSDYSSVHLRQYHYHKWSDPLPRMLQNHLIDFLNKTRAAGMVTSEGARIRPDYIIYGHIKRFDHLKIQNNDKVIILCCQVNNR